MVTRFGTEVGAGPMPGPVDPRFIQAFYAGAQVPCHVGCGGRAEVVRVGTTPDGCGELWLECGSCAQRVRLEVPKASDEEVQAVRRALEDGGEAVCPRHARRAPLYPRGRQLVCPECGILFGA